MAVNARNACHGRQRKRRAQRGCQQRCRAGCRDNNCEHALAKKTKPKIIPSFAVKSEPNPISEPPTSNTPLKLSANSKKENRQPKHKCGLLQLEAPAQLRPARSQRK